jgi:hypothetical protein
MAIARACTEIWDNRRPWRPQTAAPPGIRSLVVVVVVVVVVIVEALFCVHVHVHVHGYGHGLAHVSGCGRDDV